MVVHSLVRSGIVPRGCTGVSIFAKEAADRLGFGRDWVQEAASPIIKMMVVHAGMLGDTIPDC